MRPNGVPKESFANLMTPEMMHLMGDAAGTGSSGYATAPS